MDKLSSRIIWHSTRMLSYQRSLYFQVVIPRDTVRIVGIEATALWAPVKHERIIMPGTEGQKVGVLTLQSCGQSDLCYSTVLYDQVKQPGYQPYTPFAKGQMSGGALEPEPFDLPYCPVLQGCFYRTTNARNECEIGVALWTTVNTEECC